MSEVIEKSDEKDADLIEQISRYVIANISQPNGMVIAKIIEHVRAHDRGKSDDLLKEKPEHQWDTRVIELQQGERVVISAKLQPPI